MKTPFNISKRQSSDKQPSTFVWQIVKDRKLNDVRYSGFPAQVPRRVRLL